VLFEYFLLLHATKEVCSELVQHIEDEEDYKVEDTKKLAKKYSSRFWFHSILQMHDLRKQCVKPLLMWSMLLEYRGLSRIGQQLCSVVGAGVPIRTYDRQKKFLLKQYDKDVQDLVTSNSGISTWDNYSHIWPESGLRLDRDVSYVQSFFTVSAVSKLNVRPAQGFPFAMLANGEVLDSVPAKKAQLEPYVNMVGSRILCFKFDFFV
jgi:hypothetical protein